MTITHFRIDPALAALRKRPEWTAFHRACGRAGFFFRTDSDGSVCFTIERGAEIILAHGATLTEAHNKSGRGTPETLLALMELHSE